MQITGGNIDQLITEIKRKIPFDDLFREYYPDWYEETGNSRCPFHEDDRASFEVHKDHGYCHGGCKPPGNNGAKSFDIYSLHTMRVRRGL